MSRPRSRYSYFIYVRITGALFIIAGFYYVFNKLLDKLYGNFDYWSVYGLFLLILLFIFGFALYLKIFDRKGTIARMLGAGKEESGTGSQSPTSRIPLHMSRSDVIAIVSLCVAVASALFGYGQYVVASQSLQFAQNPNPTVPLGSSQNVSLTYPWYTNPIPVSNYQDATIHFTSFVMTTTLNSSYSILVQVHTESGAIANSTSQLTLTGYCGKCSPQMQYFYTLSGIRVVKVALNHAFTLQVSVSMASPGSPYNFYAYMGIGMEAVLFRS